MRTRQTSPGLQDVSGRALALRQIDLSTFFRPTSVVVIGASDSPGHPSTAVWRKVKAWAEQAGATVTPVNPHRSEVDGVRCLGSIHDLRGEIDLVVILVADAVAALETALERKPRFAVVFAAGFAETGAAGARMQRRLQELIEGTDTHLLGPNTNLNAFEIFEDLPGPKIALITQSGHQGRPLFQAQELGIALSHWAPTGNEADLEVADFARWFADQREVAVIAAYVEGFKDGRTLQLAADHCARAGVPIVAVKVGRTPEGRSMARSHTGHLAGADRVEGLDELQDTAVMLARSRAPSTDGVAVYAISGGTGAHMADLCAQAGLRLPELAPHTQSELRRWIPGYLRVSNPVDCGGPPVTDERGRKILDALVKDDRIGVVICPITGALPSMSLPLARDLVAVAGTTRKPICVVWGSPITDDPAYREVLVGSQLPVFRTFGNCVRSVRAYFDHHRFRSSYRSAFASAPLRRSRAAGIAQGLLEPGPLSEHTSKRVLASYGIAVTHDELVGSATAARRAAREIGYPVVMKVCSPDLVHKTDLGLVRAGIASAGEVESTYRDLVGTAARCAPEARIEGVLVCETVSRAVETVAGITRDELFGPVVMFGLGGVFVEVLDDVAFRVPPFGRQEARRMIFETKGSALLRGARGARCANIGALVDVLHKLQRLALEQDAALAELDINPLMVTEQRAVAADALVVGRR